MMASVEIYLNFNGNCAEAFEFYRSVFGGELAGKWVMQDADTKLFFPMREDGRASILNMSLPVGGNALLRGGDCYPQSPFRQGNNVYVSLVLDSTEEACRVFRELARGGEVEMPLSGTSRGTVGGMLTDRFGVPWMVSSKLDTGDE
jgi:PhnB protein